MTSVFQKIMLLLLVGSLFVGFSAFIVKLPAEVNIVITDDPTGMRVNPNVPRAPQNLSDTTTISANPKFFTLKGAVFSATKVKITVVDTTTRVATTIISREKRIAPTSYKLEKLDASGMTIGKWYKIQVVFTKSDASTITESGRIRRVR